MTRLLPRRQITHHDSLLTTQRRCHVGHVVKSFGYEISLGWSFYNSPLTAFFYKMLAWKDRNGYQFSCHLGLTIYWPRVAAFISGNLKQKGRSSAICHNYFITQPYTVARPAAFNKCRSLCQHISLWSKNWIGDWIFPFKDIDN